MLESNNDILYVVIPAYNEEENIGDVVKEWHEVVSTIGSQSKLVVVNDGSKDSTLKKLTELAVVFNQLIVLDKPNGGHGDTAVYGYKYAIDHGATYVFQTDSDGQTRPAEFPQLWNVRDEYDIQLGFRKVRQDGFARWIVTKVLRIVILFQFRTWITDANTPFRLMKVAPLSQLLEKIPKGYNLPNVLLTVMYKKEGYKYRFVKITFRPRQGGVNSINIKSIAKIGQHAVKDFAHLSKSIFR